MWPKSIVAEVVFSKSSRLQLSGLLSLGIWLAFTIEVVLLHASRQNNLPVCLAPACSTSYPYLTPTTDKLRIWSGSGAQYRNYRVLACVGHEVPKTWRICTAYDYGEPCNRTGIIDGTFGWFNRMSARRSPKHLLNDLEQLVDMFALLQGARFLIQDELPPVCVIFWPLPKLEFESQLNDCKHQLACRRRLVPCVVFHHT